MNGNEVKIVTGRPFMNAIARIISHISIVLSGVLIVLFLCDLFDKGEMSFLCNPATKWMLFSLAAISILNAGMHLRSLYLLRAMRKYRKFTAPDDE